MKKSLLVLSLLSLFAVSSKADERSWNWSPLGIGIAAPIQLPWMDSDVYGLRFGGLFGCSRTVYGLDVGLAEICSNEAVGNFAGVQASALSWTEGNAYGLQVAGLANVVKGSTWALQAAFANAVWDDCRGLQLGAVNYTVGLKGCQFGLVNWNNLASYGFDVGLINANQMEFTGWSFGALVNYAETCRGLSCGLVNCAYDVTGCQLGLVNACDHMHGVQFGLINMICGSPLPIMVIANAWF